MNFSHTHNVLQERDARARGQNTGRESFVSRSHVNLHGRPSTRPRTTRYPINKASISRVSLLGDARGYSDAAVPLYITPHQEISIVPLRVCGVCIAYCLGPRYTPDKRRKKEKENVSPSSTSVTSYSHSSAANHTRPVLFISGGSSRFSFLSFSPNLLVSCKGCVRRNAPSSIPCRLLAVRWKRKRRVND